MLFSFLTAAGFVLADSALLKFFYFLGDFDAGWAVTWALCISGSPNFRLEQVGQENFQGYENDQLPFDQGCELGWV
jgi:hypothetical protein